MPVTKDQADRLAELASDCRPFGARRWDVSGVVAAIATVKHLQLADVIMATIRAAADRSAETPAVISATTGPHWHEKVSERIGQTPPRRAEECEHHPGQRAANCGGCAADRLAGDPTPPRRTKPAPIPAEYAAARAALRTARDHAETEEDE